MNQPINYKNLLVIALMLAGCASSYLEKDKRQIIAKNEVRQRLPENAALFDISNFGEDTLTTLGAAHPLIRYTIDFHYQDSTGNIVQKKGTVLFTPDGSSLIKTEITDRNPGSE